MTVTSYFAFEIDTSWISVEDSNPEVTVVKVDRAAAESLHDELGMALYPGGLGGAEDSTQPRFYASQHDDALDPQHNVPLMTPEEALAAMQVQHEVRPPLMRGEHQSTFGTKHV